MGNLVTVHVGPLWEVQFLQGRLEADGIPTFLPDAMTKQVDPFVTGANPLAVSLMVREEDGEAALDLLEAFREAAARAGGGPEEGGEGGEAEEGGEAGSAEGGAAGEGDEEPEWEEGGDEEQEEKEAQTEEPLVLRASGTVDLAALEDLGRRIRWGCMLIVTAPIAVWLGIRYVLRLPEGGERPREHALTVVAFLIAVLICLVWAVLLAALL